MEKLFQIVDVWNLILSAVIVTFVVSAFTSLFKKTFEKEVKRKLLVGVIAALVTLLQSEIISFNDYVITLLLTWSFAVLFYTYLGKWTIQKIFEKLKAKLS